MPPARRAVAFTASVTACMLVPAATMVALLIASGSQAPWRRSIAFAIITPAFAWCVALDQGLRQQVAAAGSEMMARTAQLQHAAATARSVAYHEERRVSRALHGPVQVAVPSAAMRVETGDIAGTEQRLTDAIGHLDTGGGEQRGVARALDDIAAARDRLCTVRLDVAPDAEQVIDAAPPLASSVIDICTDACSNAVRHGDAEHITMMARRSGDAVDLLVQDDGAPGDTNALPGLGSATLDDVTLRGERRREGGSAALRATSLSVGGQSPEWDRPLASVTLVDERPLVIALCPDLMMRSRIESGLDIAGYRLRVAGGPTRLAEALGEESPACLLIDLEAGDDAIGVIDGLRADPATAALPLAAFAGHANVDLLDRAKAAGADPVVARGQAATNTGKLVEQAIEARRR